jgi:predicted PurR-regulated permease PerM
MLTFLIGCLVIILGLILLVIFCIFIICLPGNSREVVQISSRIVSTKAQEQQYLQLLEQAESRQQLASPSSMKQVAQRCEVRTIPSPSLRLISKR